MSTRSYTILKRELKQLRNFYLTTQFAYNQVKELMELCTTSEDVRDALRDHGVRWSKYEKMSKSDDHKRKVEAMLRELIFVRAISALETFLTDVIRDVFIVTKAPFMDKDLRIEMSQAELIGINTPTMIYSKIINRETRSLTSGGFNEFIKYYKKRFNIDLATIEPSYKKMNEYHDVRHILVHRLGETDEAFRKKHHTSKKRLSIDESYIDGLLDDLDKFTEEVDCEIRSLIKDISSSDSAYNARFVIDILFHSEHIPSCLRPNFQYWADDEYVMMTDVLVGTSPAEDGRVRYYFNGSDRALRHLQRHLRTEIRYKSISVLEVENLVRFERRPRDVPSNTVELVKNNLPKQPWKKGVHKDIAAKLGISNKEVSSAINILIEAGIFKDQVDGQLVD